MFSVLFLTLQKIFKTLKKLLGETVIYGIGAILPRLINFLLIRLYSDQIDKEEFSQFVNLYAAVSFINILLTFGFETSYFRYSAEKNNEKKTFNTSFWFLFVLGFIFICSVLILLTPISSLMGYAENPEYIKWFAWIAVLDAICVIPFAWLRFHNKPIKYSAIRIVQIVTQTVIILSLFLFIPREFSLDLGLQEKVSFPFLANLIGSLLGVLLLLPIILKVRLEFDWTLFKKMFKYSYPIMFAGFAFMINENFDKLVQFWEISKEDAGAYGGCYKLAVLMTLFVTAYRMGVEPFFFKTMNDKNAKKTYAQVTEYFTLFAAVVAMGLIANISWLKKIFITDPNWWTAMDIVPIIIIANLCFGVYYSLSTWYKVTDRTGFGTMISWFGAILTIVLNLLLLKKYGFMVSAWTTLIVYFSMMVLSYFLGQKYYPIPYRVKKLSLVIVILAVFSFVSYQLFNANFWVGNILFLIFAGMIIYSEKEFLISKIKK